MSALTVTLGADITALQRALAGATELVAASARRMGKMTGAGLAGLGKGGAATLSKGFDVAAIGLKVGIGAALAGGAAAMGVGVKAVTSAANFEQTKVAFTYNYFISDGSMWKGLGTVLLGLAASFGLAILNAFEMPIAYLKAGIEWCVAWMLKGLVKIPGMSKLMGFESQDVNTNFGDILKSNKTEGGSLFGVKYKDLQQENNRLIASGGEGLGKSAAEAARKAGEFGFTDTFDTTGLKNNMDTVIQSIRDSMPKPEEVKQAAKVAAKTGDTGKLPDQTSRLDP
ncbi:MAG: hypothetical protein WCP45_17990, partial [Verrucomicrobiota bacterium]